MAAEQRPGKPLSASPAGSITRSSGGSSGGGVMVTVKDFVVAALSGSGNRRSLDDRVLLVRVSIKSAAYRN
jgi:hypothetical protein